MSKSVSTSHTTRQRQQGGAVTQLLALAFALAIGVVIGGFAMRMYNAPDSIKSTTDSGGSTPALLQKLTKEGKLTIQKRFTTVNPALQGFLVKNGNNYQVAYGVGDYLLVGNLLSPEGKNMNATYTEQYRPKIDLAKVIGEIKQQAQVIVAGSNKAPMIYAFADPNCIFCNHFYEAAQPLVKDDKLQVRWILVGFLKQSSPGRAAAILTAKDPVAALADNEDDFDADKEEGGIDPLTDIPDYISKQLKANMDLMGDAGGSGTPTVLYKDKSGAWAAIYGAPDAKWLERYIASQTPAAVPAQAPAEAAKPED